MVAPRPPGPYAAARLKGVTYRIIGGDGREYGPATLDELREWITDGRVGPATMVWESDDNEWMPANRREQLRWDLPQAAPMPPATPLAPAASGVPAPLVLRVSAYLFDVVAVGLVVWLVSSPWGAMLQAQQDAATKTLGEAAPDLALLMRFYATVLAFHVPVSLAYHVGFNTAAGATPGKMLVGLRIVADDGTRLTFVRALARFAAESVSAMPLGAGYLVALFNPSRQTLHDLIARTLVVQSPTTPRRG